MSITQGPGTIQTGSGITKGYSIKSTQTLAIGTSIGDGAYGLTIPSGVSWCQLPAGVAAANDIAHPSYRDLRKDHQIQLKCLVGGVVGTTEPVWPEVGQQIVDGTVTWVVEKCVNALNQNPGYFNTAMEMLGQPLDLGYIVGGPGRRSDFIISHAYRALQSYDPGIVFVCDLFSNDVSQLNGDMDLYRSAWLNVETFLDSQVSAGRFLIVQGACAGTMFNTTALREGVAYFDTQLAQWCARNAGSTKFWHGCSEETASLVLGEDWNPDNVTTYVTFNSVFDKITDGIHPQNVASWRMAVSLASELTDLGLGRYSFRDKGFEQRYANPRNLGTAGSLGTGITGLAPTGWTVGRDGVATAVSSLTLRDDGVQGYWWNLASDSTNDGKVWAYRSASLASMGFSVGDEIECYAEIVGADMSTNSYCPRFEIAFYSATEYPSFASMNYTRGQPFGQAMTNDNVIQVMKPIPFKLKVPVGATDIGLTVSIQGSAAWSGTLRVGRININNRSV